MPSSFSENYKKEDIFYGEDSWKPIGSENSESEEEHNNRHRSSRQRSFSKSSSPSESHSSDEEEAIESLKNRPPHYRIVLRGIPRSCDKHDIKSAIKTIYRHRPDSIWISKSVHPRSAFVEFSRKQYAIDFMDDCKKRVYVRKRKVLCHFDVSHSKKSSNEFNSSPSHLHSESYQPSQKDHYFGKVEDSSPSNVIILKGLDQETTENEIRASIASITEHVVYDIRLIKDKMTDTSRGFCFVEFAGIVEATEVIRLIRSRNPPLIIHQRVIVAGFARGYFAPPKHVIGRAVVNSEAAQNAIAAAQAAQGWLSAYETSSESQNQSNTGSSDAKNVSSTIPVYDQSTGYYYDPASGLYYEPFSTCYYDAASGQFSNYDQSTMKYIPVTAEEMQSMYASGVSRSSCSTNTVNSESSKKVTNKPINISTGGAMSKKICLEMEKWAKKTNEKSQQKKQIKSAESLSTSWKPVAPTILPDSQHLNDQDAADARVLISKEASSQVEHDSRINLEVNPIKDSGDDDKIVDWDSFVCLLCRRKLSSKELLLKHVNMSDLHKKNLANRAAPRKE